MSQQRLFQEEAFVPDLASYDAILINSSGGKDSQATLDHVYHLARARGLQGRITVAHADLRDMDWPETVSICREQAEHYSLRFELVRRLGETLLERVEERGMWPDAARRWCTSDFKRGPILKLVTALVGEVNARGLVPWSKPLKRAGIGPVRVLNCMGIRAAESPSRARKPPFARNERASSGRRTVDTWYPIFSWSETEVWDRVRASGAPVHPAYALGMARASCSLCILSSKKNLVRAAQLRPALARDYARVEAAIGHDFRRDLPMREILRLAGVAPQATTDPNTDKDPSHDP